MGNFSPTIDPDKIHGTKPKWHNINLYRLQLNHKALSTLVTLLIRAVLAGFCLGGCEHQKQERLGGI